MKSFNPVTPGRRFMTIADFSDITTDKPNRALISSKSNTGGRNNTGRATNCNIGRGHRQHYRIIDFKRNKIGVPAKVATIEYDPNRSARIALLHFADGEKRYIIAPIGLSVGDKVENGPKAEVKVGNALPIRNIPAGQTIHNIEVKIGAGGCLVRSAGDGAQLVAKEDDYAQVRLPSGEVRKIHLDCYATVGQISNPDHKNVVIGKAGRSRWMNRRPHNRAITKNPCDHPMGGGEGRTKGGRHPCSRKGQLAKGLKTRHNKRTNKFIVRHRRRSVQVVG